ncbi:MAG TPA: hypothetical protein VF444_00660 [Pseudonocardiaceae bacterium]
MTKKYKATATREGRLWVIDVPGVGVTQGRTVAEAREMTRDLIAAMTDVRLKDVDIDTEWPTNRPVGGPFHASSGLSPHTS